ncbi:MAG: hypothetical protein K5Q68_03880 [Roseococcus sp.]|nr:hypothetical protein [Roseococcus sp.]
MTESRKLRELRHAISQASDRQLRRLVPVLDALPERSVADALLDGARPRLRHLRAPRPINVARVLFLPLDPLIVPPRDWKPGQSLLPRSILAPLAQALVEAQPELVAHWKARLEGMDLRNTALIREAGAALWPAAAALPRVLPSAWGQTGLPPHAFPEMAGLCAALWRHGPALMRLRLAGADGPPEGLARPIFRLISAEGSEVVGLCLRTLLPHAAKPAQLAAMVAGLGAALAPVAERALDQYLEAAEPGLDAADLGTTAAIAQRFATLLDDLDRSVTRDKPRRAQLLQTLRRSAAESCVERLRGELPPRLMEPLEALLDDPAPSDTAVETVETAAMALRSLADSARRLHAPISAERLLEPSVSFLARQAAILPELGPRFLRADALRLIQILAGPAEATRVG